MRSGGCAASAPSPVGGQFLPTVRCGRGHSLGHVSAGAEFAPGFSDPLGRSCILLFHRTLAERSAANRRHGSHVGNRSRNGSLGGPDRDSDRQSDSNLEPDFMHESRRGRRGGSRSESQGHVRACAEGDPKFDSNGGTRRQSNGDPDHVSGCRSRRGSRRDSLTDLDGRVESRRCRQ